MKSICSTTPARQRGLTLVELMIALTLGLVLLGGVVGVLIANKTTFRASEALGRMQENARFAFEILGRSIREAGGNACGANMTRVANVLNNRDTDWWANWSNVIRGFESGTDDSLFPKAMGSGITDRVSGTDALIVMSGAANEGIVITDHDPPSAQFKVNTAQHGLVDGDIVMVCDNDHAAIFQVTNASSGNVTIVHNTGTGTPGNCSKGLGYPTVCTALGNPYTYQNKGFISKLSAEAWYIGNNSRGGRSLYRMTLRGASPQTEEVVPDVRDLQLAFLTRDGSSQSVATDYVAANQITWSEVASGAVQVLAVRIELETQDAATRIDNQPLTRRWATIVKLRNVE